MRGRQARGRPAAITQPIPAVSMPRKQRCCSQAQARRCDDAVREPTIWPRTAPIYASIVPRPCVPIGLRVEPETVRALFEQ